MSPLNRREFIFSGVAVSAATVLAIHLSSPSEIALEACRPVAEEAGARPAIRWQFDRDRDFVSWREQGWSLCGGAFPNRQSPKMI